jgi:uncharacterized membrane protein required for colicin V production
MDLSLIIFIIIVAFFAFSGYRSGFLVVLSRLISLPVAYVVALFFTQPVGQWLQTVSPLQGLMTYIVAGFLLFFMTAGILSLLFKQIQRLTTSVDAPTSQISAVGGGILGALIGLVIGLIAVWFSSTMQTLIQSKQGTVATEPGILSKKVKQIASGAIGGLTKQITGADELSQATAALIANPAENIERIQRINQKGILQQLFRSNAAIAALNTRNAAALMETPAFKNLISHPDFGPLASELTGSNPQADMAKVMAIKITTVWAQMEAVKHDPQFVQLTQDPEVAAMIRSANFYQMMGSAKIEKLLNVIASVKAPEIVFEPLKTSGEQAEVTPQIYRWVDKNGKVHYSDKPNQDEQ